jgi:acyl-CoA dehydrogenase
LERAFKIIKAAEAAEAKIRKAIKAKKLPKVKKFAEVADQALQQGIIDNAECENLKLAEEVRADAIQVDSFSQEEYMGMGESNKANLKRIS